MGMLRRAVLLLLLLTMPFQAALGATGLLCAITGHHSQNAEAVPHSHDSAIASGHHRDELALDVHRDGVAEPASHESHGALGKCKVCSECCFSAAAILAAPLAISLPDAPLRVSSIVEPHDVTRAGDGLFRPPRSTIV
jgi:hypothetical protein